MNSTLVLRYDNLPSTIDNADSMRTNGSASYKIGKLAGRTKKFFQRTENKVTAITTYWALETVIFALFIFGGATIMTLAIAIALYLYGTYATFSAVHALVGAN